MNQHKVNTLASTVILLIFFAVPTSTSGSDSMVKRIVAEAADGVVFSIWLEGQTVKSGQPIIIHYRVENRSAKTIYLVRDNTSKPTAERGTILIQEPFVSLGGHEGYDYSFTKVGPEKSYENKVIISRERYEPRPWRIDVGFGYVNDLEGLDRQLGQGEDPLSMKALLNSRIKTLSLGSLRMEVLEE